MITFEKAFALLENPFQPRDTDFLGVNNRLMMQNLSQGPLKVHRESGLMKLYVPQAGRFEEHLQKFEGWIEDAGYTANPPDLGLDSFISFVHGSAGTGKTSLTNVMMYKLQERKPQGKPDWCFFEPWGAGEDLPPDQQTSKLTELEESIPRSLGPGQQYAFVVADNIRAGVDVDAVNMYVRLQDTCFIFLFLLSSDPDFLDKRWDDLPVEVRVFDTAGLTPDHAVDFVKHRISRYRKGFSQVIDEYDLFPFTEDDIREAVQTRGDEGIITLRQLNGILKDAISDKRRQMDDNFDIARASDPAAKQHLISVSRYFEEKMRQVA